MTKIVSPFILVVGTIVEFTAFDVGSWLSDGDSSWTNLRHFPVLLTVIGLAIWTARRFPSAWVRAEFIHIPAIFVLVTIAYEVVVRNQTGQHGVLDGTVAGWGGVSLGAFAMGLVAVVVGWLEPGTRARRAASPSSSSSFGDRAS